MTYIRVDPPSLRQQAKELEQHAEQLHQLAERVLASAEVAPSYDGQFGPKVRGLAAQAHAELSRRAANLQEFAEQLGVIAGRFEQADLESVAGMEGLAVRMQGWAERSEGVLAAWAQSGSGRAFFQRLSSLASELDEGSQPWWAPIVLGWQGTWGWFDRNIGAPIREGLLPRVGPSVASSQTPTPNGTPRPGVSRTASTDGTQIPMGLISPIPMPIPRAYPQPDESNAVTSETGPITQCPVPFLDPEANENLTITGQMRFVEPPFSLLEGNPNDPKVDLAGNKLAWLIQAADLFNDIFIDHANADFTANIEPNVDFSLHYSTYDDGVRIPGLTIENQSEMPIVVGRVEIEQWSAAQEGGLPQFRHRQDGEVVIQPGGFEYLHLDLSDTTFPPEARIDLRAVAAGVASPAPFGQIGWSVWGFGGASQLPPGP